MKNYPLKICLCSVMAALYVVLDLFSSYLSRFTGDTFKISLSALPIMIVAVILGPVWAMATGFTGAFIGQLLGPYGITVTTLLWCLPAVVRAASFGLLFIAFKKSIKRTALSVSSIISSVLVTVTNTAVLYLDSVINHYSSTIFGTVLIYRFLIGIISGLIFAFILPEIIKLMSSVIKKV